MYPAKFAAVYDRLMDDFDYPRWARYYLELARRAAGKGPLTLCECGCGTGSMTVELARAGVKVIGVDLSPAMLEIAGAKARKRGVMIPLVCQDMCSLSLHRPVDAIFCPCDGVNYLLSTDRVKAFFDRAFAHIKPGGVLVFDVSTPHKLLKMDQAPFYEDREEITYIWVSRVREQLVDMQLTFFLRQGGGEYLRFDEEQTQRAHTLEELKDCLTNAGFTNTQIFGDRTFEAPGEDAQRWHLCAVRP